MPTTTLQSNGSSASRVVSCPPSSIPDLVQSSRGPSTSPMRFGVPATGSLRLDPRSPSHLLLLAFDPGDAGKSHTHAILLDPCFGAAPSVKSPVLSYITSLMHWQELGAWYLMPYTGPVCPKPGLLLLLRSSPSRLSSLPFPSFPRDRAGFPFV